MYQEQWSWLQLQGPLQLVHQDEVFRENKRCTQKLLKVSHWQVELYGHIILRPTVSTTTGSLLVEHFSNHVRLKWLITVKPCSIGFNRFQLFRWLSGKVSVFYWNTLIKSTVSTEFDVGWKSGSTKPTKNGFPPITEHKKIPTNLHVKWLIPIKHDLRLQSLHHLLCLYSWVYIQTSIFPLVYTHSLVLGPIRSNNN